MDLFTRPINTYMTSSIPTAEYLRYIKTVPKSKRKGHTELTRITVDAAVASSIHQDDLNTQCTRCGCSHQPAN